MTPRTSSNKSSSPVRTTSQESITKIAHPQQSRNGMSNSPNQGQEMRSPQGAMADSHAAKTSRMEAPAIQGYGGGIPPKIEEGVEM